MKIGVAHIILTSSVAVYGDYGDALIDEDFECRPAGDYAESKLAAENCARKLCEENNIRLTILRLATVIGEGDRGNTARLITLIRNNRFLWIGNGRNKKSLIYKNDVAEGIFKAVENEEPRETETYNLTGDPIEMKEIVSEIARSLHKKTPRLRIPENFARMSFFFNRIGFSMEFLKKLEKTLDKWLSDDIFSGEKFFREFGYRPSTPINEALARQVRYYLETNKAVSKVTI